MSKATWNSFVKGCRHFKLSIALVDLSGEATVKAIRLK